MKFAVQLYNFREELAKDFRGTLKRIAEMGFDGAEFACNYGNIPPQELADFMKSINLECAGTMFSPTQLLNPDDIAWEYAKALNSPAVTISYKADFVEKYQEIFKLFSDISANAAAKGIPFTYHNHWWEFGKMDGSTALEQIIAADIPNFYLEADICWLTAAGFEPADFIRKYSKQIKQLHFKDIQNPADSQTITELGNGSVHLEAAYKAACENKLGCIIYEQDFCKDTFESAAQSLKFMKSL